MSSVVIAPARPPALGAVERGGREAARPRSALSSRVYLPAFSIAAAAVILIGVGWATGWGGADFAGSLTSLRVVVVGPLTVAIIGVFLVVERVWPAQPRSLFARGYRHDLLFTVLNATLVAPLVTALTLSFVAVARTSFPWIVLPRIGMVPRWAAIAVIVVAMDGCNWFVHLANHRVRMLWRFHELHHSQEDMSVLTVFRTHPLIHVSYLHRAGSRAGSPCQRCDVHDRAGHLRSDRRLCALEHPAGFRTARAHLRQPELSPDPPPTRRTRRRQPGLRARRSGIRSSTERCFRPQRRSGPTPACRVGRSSSNRPGLVRVISRSSPRNSSPRSVRWMSAPTFRRFGRRHVSVREAKAIQSRNAKSFRGPGAQAAAEQCEVT